MTEPTPQKYRVAIIKKATGEVVETKEFDDLEALKAWRFYWDRQGDHEAYDWRQVPDAEG